MSCLSDAETKTVSEEEHIAKVNAIPPGQSLPALYEGQGAQDSSSSRSMLMNSWQLGLASGQKIVDIDDDLEMSVVLEASI